MKVTPWLAVPAFGAVAGVVKAKVPGTEAVPPLTAESARVWPKVIAEAVGAVIVGVALFTVLETVATLTLGAPALERTIFPEKGEEATGAEAARRT